MDNEPRKICYNCFKEKHNIGPCQNCGYDGSDAAEKYPLALGQGSILEGRYTVGRVLGQGGFGITYIALDDLTKERVAIKEYFPTDLAGRSEGASDVRVFSGNRRENYEYGKEQFLSEAKTLAAFIGDSHIVRIYRYFEENGTAYFSMEYVDGLPLNKYMAANGGKLTVEDANRLLLPLMGSLDRIHAKGIVHRDIAPDNIIIQPNGTAKLIDFGAARYSTGEKSKSLDVVLKHGFAPKEQYSRHGRQGPFTDVYAMGATFYYAITGKLPSDSIDRIDSDDLVAPSTLGVKISDDAEEALLKALEVNAPDRWQSMGAFHNALQKADVKARQGSMEVREAERHQRETEEWLRRKAEEKAQEEEQSRAEQVSRGAEERTRAKEKARAEKDNYGWQTDVQRRRASVQQTSAPVPQKKPGGSKAVRVILGLAVFAAIGFFAMRPKPSPAVPMTSSTPTAVATSTPTPQATATPTPTPQATPTPVPTTIPQATATPDPSATPDSTAAPVERLAYSVGDTVTFGHYEQDSNTSNGQEAIEWIVLDVQINKVLLISRYGLDAKAYNTAGQSVTWENCTLREWLNDGFLNTAFSADEQKAIITTSVDNSKSQGNSSWGTDGGSNTKDSVFLLSYKEAEEYFDSDIGRNCTTTKYAVKQGASTTNEGECWWWLRSPGENQRSAAGVYPGGWLGDNSRVHSGIRVVRPAFWLNLKSGIF
ncbi:MAG: serine/threonine protein kinase [Oscillospiraceae bacterium]|nr:serine/threonine protein kinase [Oscillospiraceae bacterium]